MMASYFAYIRIKTDIINVKSNQAKTTHFLLSSIEYNTERQKLILFSRDKIIESNRNISLDKAFTIASTNVKYCEIYPSIDALLLLALQRVESNFNSRAVSPMGATGICQVMPVNARHLSKGYGVSFTDTMFYDVEINIRFAAQILDDALASYRNYGGALAYFNGGAYSAYYFITDNPRLNKETNQYVPNTKEFWKLYQEQYKTYQLNTINLVKIDSSKTKK